MTRIATEALIPQRTADGSLTFFSTEFGEALHSSHGAYQEALQKFVQPTELERVTCPDLCILDVCYGLGYNTATALETIWRVNPNCRVRWIGLERNPEVPTALTPLDLRQTWSPPIVEILTTLATSRQVQTERLQAQLLIGDARQTLLQADLRDFQADAIFLDPFSPPHCPQLWTMEFLGLVARHLKSTGKLATYSCAAAVRVALIAAGLRIGSTSPFGRRSPGTIASFTATNLPPLSLQEQEHLITRAAVPYRDPLLQDTADTILQRRHLEQQASTLEFTSRWKKRWLQARPA